MEDFVIRKRPFKIELNAWEWAIIDFLANERDRICRMRGWNQTPGNLQNQLEINRRGVAAELAFCKMANIYPGLTFNPSGEGIGVPDYIINGKSLDIKSTPGVTNDLMLNCKLKHHCDLYAVLAVVKHDVYYLGYHWGKVLIDEERIYQPEPLDGRSRTAFYRILNNELLYDDFWVPEQIRLSGG